MHISPISRHFAAKITSVDLKRDLDEAIKEKLKSLLSEYAVLVFPEQFLGPADLMRAGEIFGDLMP